MVSRVKLVVIGLCLNVFKTVWGQEQPIDLSSSFLARENQSICVGEVVVFTCSVNGTGILTWGIVPYVNISLNPIRFRLQDTDVRVGYTFYGSDGLYNATVTSVSPDPVRRVLGNLSSELHVVVVLGQRIEVQCGDDTTGFQTALKPPAESPSLPRNLTFSFESCGISNCSIFIHWKAPSEDGGAVISSYTLTMRILGKINQSVLEFRTKQVYTATSILYNHVYELSIAAENCNGISDNVSTFISQVGCGHPFSPVNGTIEPYNSTQEGIAVQFQCDEGYTPTEWRTSQCQENGTWAPDPALHTCTIGRFTLDSPNPSPLNNQYTTVAVVVVVIGVAVVCTGIAVVSILAWRRKHPKNTTTNTVEGNSCNEAIQKFAEQYSELQPVQSLTYAKVGPPVSSKSRPSSSSVDATRVQYASIWHNAVVEPLPSELLHPADKSMSLDQLLIQLREVEPHWMALGQAAGLEEQWLQNIQSQVSSNCEAMIEVADGWLAKLYPNKPTWREVADVVEHIGHLELARSLRQVYVTGFLPIEVSNATPSSPAKKTITTLLILPQQPSKHSDTASSTSLHTEKQPPPLPPKKRPTSDD